MTPAAPKQKKRTDPKTFNVWVRLGYGFAAGLFIEDVTQYTPPDKVIDRYHSATLTLTKGKGRKN